MNYALFNKKWRREYIMKTQSTSAWAPTNSEQINFMDGLKKQSENIDNLSLTENGALGYKSAGSSLVDITSALSSFRNNFNKGVEMFRKLYDENRVLAMRWLMWASDVREGAGERTLLRKILVDMAMNGKDKDVYVLVNLIPFYSRWDNILPLLDTTPYLSHKVQEVIHQQIICDEDNMKNGKSISLLAKWMPSINTSSKKTRELAKKIIKHWDNIYVEHWNAKKYRKLLSKLRAYLDVTEVKTSSNRWSEIDYQTVPSKANILYRNAFLKHDSERRGAFLNALKEGKATINASVSQPYEIVHNYINYFSYKSNVDDTLEAMWNALSNNELDGSTLVVADCSGSMTSTITGTNLRAIDVSHALGVYFSERCKGVYKDKCVVFSSRPRYVDFSKDKTLISKLHRLEKICDYTNTNIEATFDLILKTAVDNNLSQSDLPKTVLIISDMEFDCATSDRFSFDTLFDTIGKRFANHGYKLPKLAFWNVCSRTGTIPVKENENGVVLVSGFSTNVIKMVMSNQLDPYKAILDVILDKRYDIVDTRLNRVK